MKKYGLIGYPLGHSFSKNRICKLRDSFHQGTAGRFAGES